MALLVAALAAALAAALTRWIVLVGLSGRRLVLVLLPGWPHLFCEVLVSGGAARLGRRVRDAVLVARRSVLLSGRPSMRPAVLLPGRRPGKSVLMSGWSVLLARRATERAAVLLTRRAVVRVILLARRSGTAPSGRCAAVVSRSRGRKRVSHRRKDSD